MSGLQRRLGVAGAIVIGLGAMLGAGVFFVWAPAHVLAGEWLWLALLLAAIVATCNALSTAQLAMQHPVSGGAYAYGRAEVSPTVGFAAGWLFLTGKTCSAAAIALVAASHLLPGAQVPIAIVAIVALAALNAFGIRVTAWVSAVIVVVVLASIAVAVGWWALGGEPSSGYGWVAHAPPSGAVFSPDGASDFGFVGGMGVPGFATGPLGVLQAAGILFFAFAGYARMATLGEEVRDPKRTLPLAILGALGAVLVVYSVVAVATSTAFRDAIFPPLTPVADLVGQPVLHIALLFVGALACLGSLMGILAGLSRTSLAMARDRELPTALAHIWPRSNAPVRAELALAALAIVLVLVAPPAVLVALSSTSVLAYYGIAHVASLRLRARGEGWLPVAVSVVGLALCVLLVVTLPWWGVLASAAWLLLALGIRRFRRSK